MSKTQLTCTWLEYMKSDPMFKDYQEQTGL